MFHDHSNDPRRAASLLGAVLLLVVAGTGCNPRPAPEAETPSSMGGSTTTTTAAPPTRAAERAPSPPRDPARLLDPSQLNERAPDSFRALFTTTKGDFVIEVNRSWAPQGADRFYNLVKNGFYDDVAFFRVISGFMAQFGIHGQPSVSAKWANARIPDDPVVQSNTRGMVSFAMGGPNTRTTQLFINFGDNSRLDASGFPAFGKVSAEGMKVVDAIHSGYGEGAPGGRGPAQGRIQSQGNAYLRADFPELDYVITAEIQ